MRHRVQKRVYPERVSQAGKSLEVGAVLPFALERVALVGVVCHQHQHMALAIENRTRVRAPAVGTALRGLAAGAQPEVDRRYLRDTLDLVEHMKERVLERQINHRKLAR